MTTLLHVEGVSKQYRIYDHPGNRLKESILGGRRKYHREFWALKDVSFEVETGATVGIIGANGSGKSTLLQIITGTLEPTHGSVRHEGRISALLELGSGFNPEFTGIENVFMNATLMGLSRTEAEALLPSIERFAEIGDFIRQPVKTYSSGMFVRLAFSVAISVDPQILIVDEALSVGDAVFQHRCLRRLKEMQERGATILFVSHDAGAVRALCSRAILLNAGRVVADGKPTDVFNRYQKLVMAREEAYEHKVGVGAEASVPSVSGDASVLDELGSAPPPSHTYRHGDGSAEVLSVELLDSAGRRIGIVESGEEVSVRVRTLFHLNAEAPVCGILIRNRHGIHAYGTNTEMQHASLNDVARGAIVETTFAFACWLAPDEFSITVAVHSADGKSYDWLDGTIFFRVISSIQMDGVVNLNATATMRQLGVSAELVEKRSLAGAIADRD